MDAMDGQGERPGKRPKLEQKPKRKPKSVDIQSSKHLKELLRFQQDPVLLRQGWSIWPWPSNNFVQSSLTSFYRSKVISRISGVNRCSRK